MTRLPKNRQDYCMKFCKTCALLLCAGKGERSGLDYNKIFYRLPQGITVLEKSIDLLALSEIDKIVLVISPSDEEIIKDFWQGDYAFGGQTRAHSVKNGLDFIAQKGGCDVVVIHDCARPYASVNLVNACIQSAQALGSGVAGVTPTDTIKRKNDDTIAENLDRNTLVCVQTPQAFDFDKLCLAYAKATYNETDDSEIFSNVAPAVVVRGEYTNGKITTCADLSIKVGSGFDVHRLVESRKLILGGVEIPHKMGLLGHSDADVVLHAICDAILSAANLPDIGVLFPDTDVRYEGISSAILLRQTVDFAKNNGYSLVNVSAVIMAEKPKLAPVIPKIRQSIANICQLPVENVNVSATTTEKLGIIGQEQGIAASATCLMKRL